MSDECTVEYDSVLDRQAVDAWGELHDFVADEVLASHFELAFHASCVRVLAVQDRKKDLILTVASDVWSGPREFGLLADSSLVWAGQR